LKVILQAEYLKRLNRLALSPLEKFIKSIKGRVVNTREFDSRF